MSESTTEMTGVMIDPVTGEIIDQKGACGAVARAGQGVGRDRDGSFGPVIVPTRKRRLDGIDQIVLSLSARGLTTGEIAAHFEEVYGARVSKDTVSRITEKVVGELAEWSARPLDPIYAVLFR